MFRDVSKVYFERTLPEALRCPRGRLVGDVSPVGSSDRTDRLTRLRSGASLRPLFALSPALVGPTPRSESSSAGRTRSGLYSSAGDDVDVVWYRPDQEPKGPSRGEAGTREHPAVLELPADRHDVFGILVFSHNVTIKETRLRHLLFGSGLR